MFLLIVSYTKPFENVSLHVETHSTWVKKYIEKGLFMFAGPKKSKLGGAILVKSIDIGLLREIIAEDSFVINDVAEYQIVDFDCKLTTPGLELLKTV